MTLASKGLRGFFAALRYGSPYFNEDKKKLIDLAFKPLSNRGVTFADLGGIWGVNGAYTFYALNHYDVKRAWLVDTRPTPAARRRSQRHPNLTLLQNNFGRPEVPEAIGEVDALFLFDVLLHQVAPDWDELLSLYASHTKRFVIYNPQWTGVGSPVRLPDLGRDEYFRQTPARPEQAHYQKLFANMHEMNAEHGRPWRDIHPFWQWGISDGDLVRALSSLGFRLTAYENFGRFGQLPQFERHGFIFEAGVD